MTKESITGRSISTAHEPEVTPRKDVAIERRRLWHTLHNTDGTWQTIWGDVNSEEKNGGDVGPMTDVSCSGFSNGDLHVVALTDLQASSNAGHVWHTIRFAGESWQNFFGAIDQVVANTPEPFTSCSCVADNTNNVLHVCCGHVVNFIGDVFVWHTTRNGGWESPDDTLHVAAVGAGAEPPASKFDP